MSGRQPAQLGLPDGVMEVPGKAKFAQLIDMPAGRRCHPQVALEAVASWDHCAGLGGIANVE